MNHAQEIKAKFLSIVAVKRWIIGPTVPASKPLMFN